MVKIIVSVCAGVLLTGCASGYSASGWLSDGYDETQLGPDVYRVSFEGNSHTSMQRAADFALLRSAELTLDAGYSHFQVLDERQWIESESLRMPAQTTTTAAASGAGNVASAAGTSVTIGGETLTSEEPRVAITIRLLNGDEAAKEPIYDASFLVGSLKEKYGIETE